jgi:hypothetical protein
LGFDLSWRSHFVERGMAIAEWASHITGWLRTLPFRSVISAQLTSSLSRRKTPSVPWYVPWASTTSSPSRNVETAGRVVILFVYLFSSSISFTAETWACSQPARFPASLSPLLLHWLDELHLFAALSDRRDCDSEVDNPRSATQSLLLDPTLTPHTISAAVVV